MVQLLSESHRRNIIILSGAGISTAAGIPDFRSPKSGLYANLKKYNLPYPEAIFDIEYFMERPEPFGKLARELFPGMYHSSCQSVSMNVSFRPVQTYLIPLLYTPVGRKTEITPQLYTEYRYVGTRGRYSQRLSCRGTWILFRSSLHQSILQRGIYTGAH